MNKVWILLVLASCTGREPVATPVTVDVPVAVSCQTTTIAEPDWNIKHLGQNASHLDKLKAALADLDLSKGYIDELHAQLAACL